MSKIALSAPVAGVGTATIKGPETASDIEFQLPPRAGQVMVAGPAFHAHRAANLAVTSGVDALVLFDTEVIDTDGRYDPVTGRFTPNVAGIYMVVASVRGYAASSFSYAAGSIRKNGSKVLTGVGGPYAGAYGHAALSLPVFLNGSTDYLDVVANITGTSPTVLGGVDYTTFGAVFVRPA